MAIKVTYVVKESVNNLRRNILMTAAALLTVIISLALAGAALLFRGGVDNATTQFKGGFDIAIFMNPNATQDQIDAVGRELKNMPELDKVEYVDHDAAYAEIKRLFQNDPATLSAFTGPEQAPTQWRVKPKDPEQIETIGERFSKRAGVFEVSYAKAVKLMLKSNGEVAFSGPIRIVGRSVGGERSLERMAVSPLKSFGTETSQLWLTVVAVKK